jgi:hypothetical protein
MRSCRDTCDNRPVARPATGKTPLRNLRSDNEVWLPALARTVADGTTATDLVNEMLSEYGSGLQPLTFSAWPAAPAWLAAEYPAWTEVAAELEVAAPGLADTEYIGVALWLAITRRRDRKQQQNVIAGFLLARAITITAGGWREKYADTEDLLQAINQVLDIQMRLRPPPPVRRGGRADGATSAARRAGSGDS